MSAVGSFLFFLWAFHGIVLDIWTDITDPYSRITISDLMIPGYGNPGDHLKEIRLVDYDTLKEVEAVRPLLSSVPGSSTKSPTFFYRNMPRERTFVLAA
jgi:hypothetical protein